MSVRILDNGLVSQDGFFRHLWFRLGTPQGECFRIVALRELAVIPVTQREDFDLLGKQWAAIRGLHNAEVDFLYSACGMYHPDHVGIMQFYGSTAEDFSLDAAVNLANRRLKAIEASLVSGYRQTKLRAPLLRDMEWYIDFVTRRGTKVLALLGHPDPRETKRGSRSIDGQLPDDTEDDLASEQNELLFRGLAKLQEDFIFQVTSHQMSRGHLSDALVRIAQVTSNVASRRRGAISLGFNLSIPLMAAVSNAYSGGHSSGLSEGRMLTEGATHGWGRGHTDSEAHTESFSHTEGESESRGIAITHTEGKALTLSESDTKSHAITEGEAHTQSHAVTNSRSETHSQGSYSGWSQGGSITHSQGESNVQGSAVSESDSQGWSNNLGGSVGGQGSVGIPATLGGGINAGINASVGQSGGHTDQSTLSNSHAESSGVAVSSQWGSSGGESSGHSVTQGRAVTRGEAHTQSRSETWGEAHTEGRAVTTSEANSITESHQWGEFKSNTWGRADTKGQAESRQENWGKSHQEAISRAQNLLRTGQHGFTGGLSTGLMPGVSLNRSWQTEDHVADRLAEVLGQLEGMLNVAASEGGFMTDVTLITASEEGLSAAEALAPQAFHGINVPTPVLTVRPGAGDDQRLRENALAFLPWGKSNRGGDPFEGLLWNKYATLLTASQLAAYTAPGLFEEGTALTVMAPIPEGVAFYPNMHGDVILGHQFSPETADLTNARVRLNQSRLMHTMFAADTGWGKSVAAVRMAYETTIKWKTRTVVLDFGAGWRQLLNAPGLEGHVDVLQLWPDAVRPLRWNPLQIGRNINPETQWRAFADIFGSIAKLGVRRQKQEMLQMLRNVYVRAGVLIDDPEVRGDPEWGKVKQEEESLVSAPAGTALGDLSRDDRQALAVLRSMKVGLTDLYQEVNDRLDTVPPRDVMLTGVLDGIKFRLQPLVQGSAAAQFSSGENTMPLEDLSRPWGITIIEGGIFLDDFGKAFLLGWAGWHLYTDMVARRVHEANQDEPLLQIFFEEANKIFGGVDDGTDSESGGISTSQRFGDMFRDARKYDSRLHVITQAPHMIPADIISSCNNLVIGFLKEPDDKDVVLSALARSEKGFRDEEWRRFLSDLHIGMAIGRFPYDRARQNQRPMLFQPLLLNVPEPKDQEIAQKLGRIDL